MWMMSTYYYVTQRIYSDLSVIIYIYIYEEFAINFHYLEVSKFSFQIGELSFVLYLVKFRWNIYIYIYLFVLG